VIEQENPLVNAVVIPVPEAVLSSRDESGASTFELPKQYIRTNVAWEQDEEIPA
jgi:hypothetical protein